MNGRRSTQTADREALLRQAVPESLAVQFQKIKEMRREELREAMIGEQRKDVVYVYHNSIDASGDHPSSEADVFLRRLKKRLTISVRWSIN
ncbi:PglZ domain-containing protein [Terrilactibacillus sp. S3-3]|nr:PglZ domain-containing protein [Terrilactibacillus sp. S3-3]